MSTAAQALAGIYAGNEDPWGYRTRWYEQRKRAVLCAGLTRERYRRVLECGCSNGELSAQLLGRCDALVALDADLDAVALASERLRPFGHAQVLHMRLPAQWPAHAFDLIVVSEMAYYLDDEELQGVLQRIAHGLAPGGEVVACHWRHAIEGAALDADEIDARFDRWADAHGMARVLCHREPDFIMGSWSREARTVAQREGLL